MMRTTNYLVPMGLWSMLRRCTQSLWFCDEVTKIVATRGAALDAHAKEKAKGLSRGRQSLREIRS